MKILNAFSLSMLTEDGNVSVSSLPKEKAAALLEQGYERCVGHADTAALFAKELGVPVAFNRTSVQLKRGESALVGQYTGPRLPEGTTVLPEGAAIQWKLVSVY
jgi:hypothetical protein